MSESTATQPAASFSYTVSESPGCAPCVLIDTSSRAEPWVTAADIVGTTTTRTAALCTPPPARNTSCALDDSPAVWNWTDPSAAVCPLDNSSALPPDTRAKIATWWSPTGCPLASLSAPITWTPELAGTLVWLTEIDSAAGAPTVGVGVGVAESVGDGVGVAVAVVLIDGVVPGLGLLSAEEEGDGLVVPCPGLCAFADAEADGEADGDGLVDGEIAGTPDDPPEVGIEVGGVGPAASPVATFGWWLGR